MKTGFFRSDDFFVELDSLLLQQNTNSHSAPLKRADCSGG